MNAITYILSCFFSLINDFFLTSAVIIQYFIVVAEFAIVTGISLPLLPLLLYSFHLLQIIEKPNVFSKMNDILGF